MLFLDFQIWESRVKFVMYHMFYNLYCFSILFCSAVATIKVILTLIGTHGSYYLTTIYGLPYMDCAPEVSKFNGFSLVALGTCTFKSLNHHSFENFSKSITFE